jgi:L-lactate dehydrogenase complex protein LldG
VVAETEAVMTDARSEILERVSGATRGAVRPDSAARSYRRVGELGKLERARLFCHRVGEYRAEVQRIEEPDIADAVARACAAHGAQRIVAPSGIPDNWRPATLTFVDDDALSPREVDAVAGTLTGCTVAIAETGTIILTAGPREGRRALSLVPDLHVCVVSESQIVELVPEAFALLGREGLERRPITLISGPSATSDIELSRVEGVHGPRSLVVLVVGEDLSAA